MKKCLYSQYTKFAAVVLFAICIVIGAFSMVNGFEKYIDSGEYVYNFEKSFDESVFVKDMLDDAEYAVFKTYTERYGYDDEDYKTENAGQGDFYEELGKNLIKYTNNESITYYVSVNGREYTNRTGATPEELRTDRFYHYYSQTEDGRTKIDGIDKEEYVDLVGLEGGKRGDSIVICTNLNEESANEIETMWFMQEAIVKAAIVRAFICAVLMLLIAVYLIAVAGRNAEGETGIVWVDRIWTEVHMAIIVFAGIFTVLFCAIMPREYQSGNMPRYILNICVCSVAAAGGELLLNSALSVVRKLKNGMLLRTCIICITAKWLWHTFVKIFKKTVSLKNVLFKKTSLIMVSMLFVYTLLMGMCGVLSAESGGALLWALLLFAAAVVFVAYRSCDIDKIRKGVRQIRTGNISYEISDIKSGDMRELAQNINEIGDGLNKSVSAKIKAERMKTELITNVSHDLKTPLTSIISYTELLSELDGLSEEARDYVAVIAKKSERLKNLTRDLFDVSKVQSGTESFTFERLDMALLVNQAMAEINGEIQKSGLQFLVNTEKDLYISADGGKMSRVLTNLLDNAVKYAMKNTRVFVSVYEKNGKAVTEIKNISAYEMDFDGEEIVGRFVRGDKSRSEDGSGLGLAIAKGYVEALGGDFEITVDGDLFKTVIKFDKM